MANHPLLKRQIQRFLEDNPETLSANLLALLETVDVTYEALDGQRIFLRQIIDQNPNFIFVKDGNGQFRLVNQAVAETFGLALGDAAEPAQDPGNTPVSDIVLADDRELFQTLTPQTIPESVVTDRAGNARWLQTYKRPIKAPDGKEQMILGVAMDITARKLAEDSLHLRTEQILKHKDALHELAISGSEDLSSAIRNIIRVSSRTLNAGRTSVWLFNSDRTELHEEYIAAEPLARNESASLSLNQCPRYFQALEEYRTMAVHDAPLDPRTLELQTAYLSPRRIASKLDASIRRHGNVVGVISHEQVDKTRQWTLEEEHFAASLADLVALALAADERRSLEEQLRQSQKMEAVGVLAGGVAHDFSNLLTVMLVYADLLAARIQSDATAVKFVDQIQGAALRAEGLTRQLLAFSRKQVLNPKVLDLNSVVRNMESLLRPMIGEDIELVTTLAHGLSRIKADRGQIEQVLMNLAVNARDAMPAGGRLRIATANLGPGRSLAHRSPDGKPHFVLLVVSDTGLGMDEGTLSRIFEPFFTTKLDGRGSGLGLSTVYGIVEQSGGQIEVESSPSLGTRFRIYLPAVVDEIEQVPLPPAVEVQSTTNRETILLVEDEESLRMAAVHALRERGYKVYEVNNGVDALHLSERLTENIDLLITDIVMPQMDGRELAACVTRARPGTRVLYVSGYAKGAILDKASLEPNSEFLAKPFRLSELLQKVREVVGTISAGSGDNGS